MIDTVVMFYDYLLRHDDMENLLSEKLVKFVRIQAEITGVSFMELQRTG